MPPGASAGQTSAIMRLCLAWHKATLSSDHCSTACASLRNIPSPEQGTSATITSKKPGRAAKAFGSSEVTATWGSPHSATFPASTPALDFITSFATSRKPSPAVSRNDAAKSVVLPPGAAQRSSTLSGLSDGKSTAGRMLRNTCPTNIEDESCT